jgi:hypothetical protein
MLACMGDPTSTVLASILTAVADRSARQVTGAVVKTLQGMPSTLSGEDSGLGTVWLEFCAQVQGEHSIDWSEFENLVQQVIEGLSSKLPTIDQQALWLQTPAGEDWLDEPSTDPALMPVDPDDVVGMLYSQVWKRAADWEDDRLEAFLCGGDDGDDLEEAHDD